MYLVQCPTCMGQHFFHLDSFISIEMGAIRFSTTKQSQKSCVATEIHWFGYVVSAKYRYNSNTVVKDIIPRCGSTCMNRWRDTNKKNDAIRKKPSRYEFWDRVHQTLGISSRGKHNGACIARGLGRLSSRANICSVIKVWVTKNSSHSTVS